MNHFNPIIFVHGMQGAWLKNQYPVDYQNEIYWTGILKKQFSKIHLSSIDSTVDYDIDKFIFPHQAIAFIYETIVEELRREVTEQTYVFTYDWRKDNRSSAKKLGEFVKLVLTKAKAHAKQKQEKAPTKVSLVGHSMGGLVIKWYVCQILKERAERKIDKIITIATPYRGSLKSVEALLPGARNFFGFEAQKAMRKAARTLPGVYQLLPTWLKAVVNKDTGKGVNIFDRRAWQKSLLEKLDKIYGPEFFQTMLDDAKSFTRVVSKEYKPDIRNRFYCVYGVGSETLRQVKVDSQKDNRFDFVKAGEDKQGDGTVHKLSSFVKAEGYMKDDKRPIELGGQHAQMPNHGSVQDYIVNLFTESKNLESFESKI
ncbi:MAG: lipase family alpha/beta hydrolase [Planctomycetota bacterium]|jgi:pimeloyl-ACP methyl ester carboxylesterase